MEAIKRRYDRFFIMFKQELQGYSIDGREPNGYCKIEIRDGKGRANTYIQGLRPLKDGSIYRVYLIAVQGDKALGLPTGLLEVDNKGKGECKWEFNPDNLNGTGLTIEDFNVGAVIVKGDSIKELTAPIVGYRDKEILWKSGFKDFLNNNQKNEKKEILHNESIKKINISNNEQKDSIEQKPPKEQKNISDIPTKVNDNIKNNSTSDILLKKDINFESKSVKLSEEVENNDSINLNIFSEIKDTGVPDLNKEIQDNKKSDLNEKKEDNPHKIFNDMVSKFYAEMEELEKYKILSPEDKTILDLEVREENTKLNDIDYMFKTNETIVPFENNNNSIKWIKVEPFELVTLDISAWTYIKHQFINSGWKKYKHLVLGRYLSNNIYKYILGVPDIYDIGYKSIAEELGFKKFACYKGKAPQSGALGYWLMEL